MSTDISVDLRSFHRFLGEKLAAGEIAISPEEALDEWRLSNRSDQDFLDDVAAVREALDDMASGDVGKEIAEFDLEFRRRHGLQVKR